MSRGRQGRDLSPPRPALDLAHRLSRDRGPRVRERVRPRRRRCGCAVGTRAAGAEVLGPECVTHRLPLPPRAFLFGGATRRPTHPANCATSRGASPMTTHAEHNETTVTTPTTSRNRPFGRHTTPHKSVTRLPASVVDVPSGAPGSVRTPADLRPGGARRHAVHRRAARADA